jgi:hypothetical protein
MGDVRAGTASKGRKRLVGCAVALAVVAIGLAGAGYAMSWANARADAAATRFCAQVRPGEALDVVAARGMADPASPNVTAWEGKLLMVTYSGMPFHAASCRIDVVDGKIVAAQLQIAED